MRNTPKNVQSLRKNTEKRQSSPCQKILNVLETSNDFYLNLTICCIRTKNVPFVVTKVSWTLYLHIAHSEISETIPKTVTAGYHGW